MFGYDFKGPCIAGNAKYEFEKIYGYWFETIHKPYLDEITTIL